MSSGSLRALECEWRTMLLGWQRVGPWGEPEGAGCRCLPVNAAGRNTDEAEGSKGGRTVKGPGSGEYLIGQEASG